jgi:hypothetical protein
MSKFNENSKKILNNIFWEFFKGFLERQWCKQH